MIQTLVVNYHYEDYDVLITRKSKVFGNQSAIRANRNREQVIADHFIDMQRRLRSEPDFHEQIMSLEGKRLGCVCKPMDCHGDLYVEYIKAVRTIEAEMPGMDRLELTSAAIAKMAASRDNKK